MGQNSSSTLQGVNKLNIDASDSYVTEIGIGLKKGAIPISEIIKMEKYNKLKHKLHVNPKKRYHKGVIHQEPNVKDTNCKNEMRQNNLKVKRDETINNYPRMRSGGGQNYNNLEQTNKIQKDLYKQKSPTRKEDLKEVYKNEDYPEKNNHRKNQNKSLQRRSSNEKERNTDKREELSKQQKGEEEEEDKQQKPKRFVIETNVSCIVPPKYVYYNDYDSEKDQNRKILCDNSNCPCKKHECPYLQKQKHQFASITALSQEDLRLRRYQENQCRRYANPCEYRNKMDPRERCQQYVSNVSISEENIRGRGGCERQIKRNDRSNHRDEDERRYQERRYDTYPTKRNEENRNVMPKEALENWKNMHTLKNQIKLKDPPEMLHANDESKHRYGKKDLRNHSPTVHKIWPPNRKCCVRRTSSMMSTEPAKDDKCGDGIHADLERCLLQHAKGNSRCRENDYRYSKSTWVQDRHRKWHKVMVND